MSEWDVAIIGAGIAGAGLADALASYCSVVLIEAEAQPGYHATGRSAAFWSETYGGPDIQPLTSASGGFLANPPASFSERSFLSRRGALHIGTSTDFGKRQSDGHGICEQRGVARPRKSRYDSSPHYRIA